MLIYSNSFFAEDNGNGYSVDKRDAICSKCHKVIDRQIKYRGIDSDFDFSTNEKKGWSHCPYCGEEFENVVTNADKIRSLTNEELAVFISKIELGDIDMAVTFCDVCEKDGNALGLDCDGCILHWLNSKVNKTDW